MHRTGRVTKPRQGWAWCGLVVLWVGCTGDGTTPPAASSTPAGQGRASIEQTEYDFGTLDIGQNGEHTFVLRNTGDGVLKVWSRGTSCKCTLLSAKQGELQPGESMDIRIEWETPQPRDDYEQRGMIGTSDPDHSDIPLVIRGKVRYTLGAFPDLVTFGEVRDGESRNHTVLVFSQQFEQAEIEKIESSFSAGVVWSEAAADEKKLREHVQASWGRELHVQLTPELARGEHSGQLTVHVVSPSRADPQQRRTLSIPIQIDRVSDFTIHGPLVNGRTLVLGPVSQAEGKRARCFVVVRGEHAQCEILEARSTPDFLQVKITTGEKLPGNVRRFVIDVEAPPGAPVVNYSGLNLGQIELLTSHPTSPSVKFNVDFAVF